MMVRADRLDVDPQAWTPSHLAVIRAAAQEPSVQRIFVNAAIKKALCREAKGDRRWLSKVRPMYGHDYHFHIRIKCPPGAASAKASPTAAAGEGCSACRSRLLVQGFDHSPEAADQAAEAAAADDAGAIAGGLPPGSGRAGCQAIAAADMIACLIWPASARWFILR